MKVDSTLKNIKFQ